MPFPNLSRAAPAAVAAAAAVALAACSKHPPAAPATASVGTDVTSDNVPPAMVGVWTSTRGDVMRCIELRADGVYRMVPNAEAGDRVEYHGTWRVGGGRITWRDASQNWQPDINAMVDVSPDHFTTVEADQSQTVFARIAGGGAGCPR